MTQETRQVHMLPTYKGDGVVKLWSGKLYPPEEGDSRILTQHLYVTSNEEIKKGDWYYRPDSKTIHLDDDDAHGMCDCRKIVSTTNPELWGEKNQCDGCLAGLPLENGIHKDHQLMGIACSADTYKTNVTEISSDFVEAYVKAYNQGNPFTEVIWRPIEISLKDKLDELSDEQRVDLFNHYCKHCGTKSLPCYCTWDD
jgi:hypothetical protein